MRHLLRLLIFVFCCTIPVYGQGARLGDDRPIISGQVSGGPLFSVPFAVIRLCNHPANAVPCSNLATTYTDITLGTPCATSMQIVLASTNTCVGTTDLFGNWGMWAATGTYDYTVTIPGGASLGPFTVTLSTGNNLAISTNTVPNSSQTLLNFNNSSIDLTGLQFTFTNTSAGNVQGEIAGGTLSAGFGGTGATSFTQNCLLQGNGASPLTCSLFTDNGTTGKYTGTGGFNAPNGPLSSGTAPSSATGSGGIAATEALCSAWTPTAGQDFICFDSSAHGPKFSFNDSSIASLFPTGIIKGASDAPAAAASADVVGLFTGCSGVLYLGADGACHANGSAAVICTITLGGTSTLTQSTNNFIGFTNESGTETVAYTPSPCTGTVTEMHITASAAPPYSIAFHARYQGANFGTDLTCTINTTGNTYCDITGGTQSITTGGANQLDIEAVTGTGTAAARNYTITLKVTGAS